VPEASMLTTTPPKPLIQEQTEGSVDVYIGPNF
jgi:hypothetical protein